MSKVIKASVVKTTAIRNNIGLAMPANYENNIKQTAFTKQAAEDLYLETKAMMKEVVGQAELKAEEILKNARKDAQKIITFSHQEAERIKEAAFQEGYDKGREHGLNELNSQKKEMIGELSLLISGLNSIQDEYYTQKEKDFTEMVLIICEKILGAVIIDRPDTIAMIVEQLLGKVRDAEKIIIKVNPIHIPYLEDVYKDSENTTGKISFSGDASIEEGACKVITENGFLEFSLDEQLDIIRNLLREVS